MAVSPMQKTKLVCKTTVISLIFMLVCFVIILLISFAKTVFIDEQLAGKDFTDNLMVRSMSVAVSLVITFFNICGRNAMLRLVKS